ncbi:MAG: pyruvate formate-lyase activating enzyme [Deltaproteobacteria bacterium]|nr:pyruvate formate-lyase activating enzyme [Deltaproteobacteria bacterium]
MSRFLMIDIGAGTMDLLWYDSRSNEHFKAVAPSPVRTIGEMINRTRGPLVVDGVEMGGGFVTGELKKRAGLDRVLISEPAAATLHHDMARVRSWGLVLADTVNIREARNDRRFTPITLGDIQPDRIDQILSGLDLSRSFDAVALCAQDHGTAPAGVSHLDFRHHLFRDMLDQSPQPHSLLFRDDQVPGSFSRLKAMARIARQMDTKEVYVMDSGMAAITGAARDVQIMGKSPVLVLDIATSHTVAAVMEDDTLAALLEYHTRDITLERLETLLPDLADGRIDHARILTEGGHGAYVRKAVGFSNIQAIVATGPKRHIMEGTRLPITWGAPWGDNMMTGTVGLIEALRIKKGLAPIRYI